MNTKEQDIIEQAYFHLQNELGKRLNWKKLARKAGDREYDAVFTLDGQVIYVKARNEVRPNQFERFLHFKDQLKDVIIVANYITPNAKKLLRDNGLNYIDKAGNTWLTLGPVYIHIDGLHNRPPAEDRKNRAFTKTGLKVVFQFLNNPLLVNATYREIVEMAGVALGTVPKVIEGLKEEGFLLKKTRNTWILGNYNELLNRWQEEYGKKLKRDLFVRQYRPTDPDFYMNWKKMNLIDGAQWGGEPAADLLTNYLRPGNFTLYSNQPQQDIIKKYKWVPDPEGAIYVFKKFWKTSDLNGTDNFVPLILIYADLMETGDSRCIETANILYERYIQKY